MLPICWDFRISLRLVWNVSVLCHHYWGCTRVMLASCLPSAPGPPLWGSTCKWAPWFSSVPPWLAWAFSVGCFQSLIQIFKLTRTFPFLLVPILMWCWFFFSRTSFFSSKFFFFFFLQWRFSQSSCMGWGDGLEGKVPATQRPRDRRIPGPWWPDNQSSKRQVQGEWLQTMVSHASVQARELTHI